ncbi:MAG: hypothetical protein U0984_09850 [Prosthecobacter sp.]|nr:hypothetical protein [Prosthecobacter sp.]
MPPLLNPRYEAFAFALAAGSTVGEAYDEAGFHPNNRRSRADLLSQSPKVQARVAHLRATLDPAALRRRHAPACTTLPQTQEDMKAWLWQIMAGVRKINIRQWQAAKLFARMSGWDALLRKDLNQAKPGAQRPEADTQEPENPAEPDLPETTRVSLYLLSLIQADKEALRSASPLEPELHDFDYYPDSDYLDPPLVGDPPPDEPEQPGFSPRQEPGFATQASPAAAYPDNQPFEHYYDKIPRFPVSPFPNPGAIFPPIKPGGLLSPWGYFGDRSGDIKSPTQTPDPQPITPETQKPGDQKISSDRTSIFQNREVPASESTLAFQSRDAPERSEPSGARQPNGVR